MRHIGNSNIVGIQEPCSCFVFACLTLSNPDMDQFVASGMPTEASLKVLVEKMGLPNGVNGSITESAELLRRKLQVRTVISMMTDEDVFTIVDDEGYDLISFEMSNDWTNLETMQHSHPMHFARKIAKVIGTLI